MKEYYSTLITDTLPNLWDILEYPDGLQVIVVEKTEKKCMLYPYKTSKYRIISIIRIIWIKFLVRMGII